MLLKAKFAHSPEVIRAVIADENVISGTTALFHVLTVNFDPKKCDVVGEVSPIMYLIGAVAARGEASLLGVTQV